MSIWEPIWTTNSLGLAFVGGTAQTYAQLPAAAANLDKAYYVFQGSGIWFINRKPSGWYWSDGATWIATPNIEDYFENVLDSKLIVKDDADPTKAMTFQLENITTGQTRTITMADRNIDLQNPLFDSVQLDTAAVKAYLAGQISYDIETKTVLADTGFTGVRVNIGQENHVRFFNNTGVEIPNGTPINSSTPDVTNGIITGIPADAASSATSLAIIGLATHAVPDQTWGLATRLGEVNGVNTVGLTAGGILYLASGGGYSNVRPKEPEEIAILGTVEVVGASGRILVDLARFRRRAAGKSYGFTSQGVAAGTYYKAGFYDWEAEDANLTQALTSVTQGAALHADAGHPGIVPSGPGTVDTGQVGLRVTGTKDDESGVQMAAQTSIITEDITTLVADVLAETVDKYSGLITFELYVVSGTPTTYSLDFNYGTSKYEDFQNRDVTITEVEAVWLGAANDSISNIELLHHKATGWAYAATGFIPGDGAIIEQRVDQAIAGNVANGVMGAWKRVGLNQFVEGSGLEGVLFRITTGQNNTYQSLDLHISGVSEELTR